MGFTVSTNHFYYLYFFENIILLSRVLVTNNTGSGLENGFIYSWYTPTVITRNYSAIAIFTIYNSLLHSLLSSPGKAIKTQEL
jgi:hypothetical protein